MDINLNLRILENARMCNNECKEKLDDGSLHGLTNVSSFSCVGCGRACHMECHKVPKSLSEAIKKIPMNNRVHSFFGEFSYMRLVCENCANWLMVDMRVGETPSFLLLFTKLVNKIIKDKYVLKSGNEVMVENSEPANNTVLNARVNAKRKKTSENDIEETGLINEMKKMMASCLEKLEVMDKKIDTNHKDMDSGISTITDMTIENTRSITGSLSTMDNYFGELRGKLLDIDGKIDSKHGEMENGIQEGFNNLINKTEKLLSPMTPKRNGRNVSFRQQAMVNSARKFSAAQRLNSDVLKTANTSHGSSIENESFGTVIPRRLFNSSDSGARGFIHDKAIHLRYVDPIITPNKILGILKKNSVISDAIKNNSKCIEINRLTKRHLTEEEIRSLKYGVSYRIGSDENIFDIVKGGSLFAPHWEIRDWIERENNTTNNIAINHDANTNALDMNKSLRGSSDFLRDNNDMIIVD